MQIDEQNVYIDPTDENGAALFRRQISGEVVMLNLLRFRPVADYTDFPNLAPVAVERIDVTASIQRCSLYQHDCGKATG
jgi:hypothetical protein